MSALSPTAEELGRMPKEGDTIVVRTPAACPECGTALESCARIRKVMPDGMNVEFFVDPPELRCPSAGCDIGVVEL